MIRDLCVGRTRLRRSNRRRSYNSAYMRILEPSVGVRESVLIALLESGAPLHIGNATSTTDLRTEASDLLPSLLLLPLRLVSLLRIMMARDHRRGHVSSIRRGPHDPVPVLLPR